MLDENRTKISTPLNHFYTPLAVRVTALINTWIFEKI